MRFFKRLITVDVPQRTEGSSFRASGLPDMDFSFLTLKDLVQERFIEPGERLHILSLRRFKQALGEEWQHVVKRVHLAAENTVSRHLEAGDRACAEDDDTFIVHFDRLADEDAERKVREIATDLMRRLIGERFLPDAVQLATIPAERILVDGALDQAAVDEAIRQAKDLPWHELVPDDKRIEPWSSLEPPSGSGGAASWRRAGEGAPATRPAALERPGGGAEGGPLMSQASDARGCAQPGWQAMSSPSRPRLNLGAASGDVEHGSAENAHPEWRRLVWRSETTTIPPVKPDAEAGSRSTPLMFLPAWDTLSRRRNVFRCAEAGGCAGPAAAPRRQTSPESELLAGALRQLLASIDRRKPVYFIVPLRFSSLRSGSLQTIEHVLRSFPDAARARWLFLELTGFPKAVSIAELDPLCRSLKGLCRDLLFRVDRNGPGARVIAAQAPLAVGVDLGSPAAPLAGLLPQLRGTARSYLWGVDAGDRPGDGARFDHWLLSGAAIGGPVTVPE